MKVLCKYAENADVPQSIRHNNALPTSRFDVVVGRKYTVFGLAIFARRLHFLIDPDDACRPNWYPPELFEVMDGRVPNSWVFDFYPEGYSDDLGAICGYGNLVNDPEHFNALAEREPDALAVFARYKEWLRTNDTDR